MIERDHLLSALEVDEPGARLEHVRPLCRGDEHLFARRRPMLASQLGAVQRNAKRIVPAITAFLLMLFIVLGISEATGVTAAASNVIRLTTGSGTLVIESNDPTVIVTIDGEEVSIRGAGVEELRLRPGKHRLAAVKNGKPVKRELVTITRNGRTVVRVSREPAAAAGEAAGPRFTPRHQWPADAPSLAIAPYDEAIARKHQQAWAKYLGVPVEKEDKLSGGISLKMVLIPPGEFLMGSTKQERTRWLEEAKGARDGAAIGTIPREAPQHRVRLTSPFYLAVHEVTQDQYRQVMGVNPSRFPVAGDAKDAGAERHTNDHPVDHVSWFDAIQFCNKLSRLEKRQPCYEVTGNRVTVVPGNGYRLPSEAEWEHACRAGSATTYYPVDEDKLGDYAWYGENSKKVSHAVGEKLPNGFGLYDMHGSIWEWCQDWHGPQYYEQHDSSGNVVDPFGPAKGSNRVLRGGYWNSPARRCRSAYRYSGQPDYSDYYIGFRVASAVVKE